MSAAGRMLSQALDDPDAWQLETHVLYHKPSGTRWWVGNGWMFFNGYSDTSKCLTMFERFWLYRKYKRMMNLKIAGQLAKGVITGGHK